MRDMVIELNDIEPDDGESGSGPDFSSLASAAAEAIKSYRLYRPDFSSLASAAAEAMKVHKPYQPDFSAIASAAAEAMKGYKPYQSAIAAAVRDVTPTIPVGVFAVPGFREAVIRETVPVLREARKQSALPSPVQPPVLDMPEWNDDAADEAVAIEYYDYLKRAAESAEQTQVHSKAMADAMPQLVAAMVESVKLSERTLQAQEKIRIAQEELGQDTKSFSKWSLFVAGVSGLAAVAALVVSIYTISQRPPEPYPVVVVTPTPGPSAPTFPPVPSSKPTLNTP